ncbi:hypothetical protein ABE869_10155 [Enterococcus gilvus]|uniref:hypothetical protein n=1 Tax=Enterococcus gilvus TaxID=160453 RepID=UPI003D6C2A8D
MLYEKLMSIYQNNKFLRENFDFNIYYKRLSQYISVEVNQGNEYISPFRFSKMFDTDLEDTIRYFLSISSPSDERFIQIMYKYKCENCGSLNFFSSKDVLNDDLRCVHCDDEVYGINMDIDRFVLVFELSEVLKDEFRSLKIRTLSKNDADIGRGISMGSASSLILKNPEINPELNRNFQEYWDIANG